MREKLLSIMDTNMDNYWLFADPAYSCMHSNFVHMHYTLACYDLGAHTPLSLCPHAYSSLQDAQKWIESTYEARGLNKRSTRDL